MYYEWGSYLLSFLILEHHCTPKYIDSLKSGTVFTHDTIIPKDWWPGEERVHDMKRKKYINEGNKSTEVVKPRKWSDSK